VNLNVSLMNTGSTDGKERHGKFRKREKADLMEFWRSMHGERDNFKNSSTLTQVEQILPATPQPFSPGILDDDHRRAGCIPVESDLSQNGDSIAFLVQSEKVVFTFLKRNWSFKGIQCLHGSNSYSNRMMK
jgi:hypothetical protein